MAIDITPEYAQALRDGTASSPWIVEDYGGNRSEVMIETSDGDTLAADVEPDVAQLIAAAPDMAKQIASMHYEYAVRTSRDGKGDYVYTSIWYLSYDEAADRAAEVKRVNPHTTIIRRLVGEPEAVE